MSNNETVVVRSAITPASVGPGMSVAYACLCIPFWANAMGFCNSAGFALSMGLVQLGYFVLYLVCGMYFLKQGSVLAGGVYVVFSAAFGLFGGFGNVGSALCMLKGIEFDSTITSIAFLVSGIFMLVIMPCVRNASKCDFLVYLGAGIGVTSFGLAGVGVLSNALNLLGGWGIFLSGICGFYGGIAGFLHEAGIELPCGKPFFKS